MHKIISGDILKVLNTYGGKPAEKFENPWSRTRFHDRRLFSIFVIYMYKTTFLLTFIGQEHFVFWNMRMHLSSSQRILRMSFAVIVVKIWSGQQALLHLNQRSGNKEISVGSTEHRIQEY
jgi:hypothetical protein